MHVEQLKNEAFPVEARDVFTNSELIKAIHRSQHTQRNYDLSKKIPIEDIKTIITAATQCPSKQNVAFYNLHVIVNRDVINTVYETTTNIHTDDSDYEGLSNPQVLANMLLVFSEKEQLKSDGQHREARLVNNQIELEENNRIVEQDKFTALGIAAGYVNLTASLLGYETGCCSCVMNRDLVQELIGSEGQPLLLMGVGFKNNNVNRREHPLKGSSKFEEMNWVDKFPTFKKENIGIYYIR